MLYSNEEPTTALITLINTKLPYDRFLEAQGRFTPGHLPFISANREAEELAIFLNHFSGHLQRQFYDFGGGLTRLLRYECKANTRLFYKLRK